IMTKFATRSLIGPILFGVLMSPLFVHCGGGLPGMSNLPGGGGACPVNMASAEAIANADFKGEFKLQAETAQPIKAGVSAAVELEEFSAKLDADLKTACAGLASDLGETGDYKNGEEACKAALKAMGNVKAKIGANAKMTLVVQPPRCEASMDVMADCAGKC